MIQEILLNFSDPFSIEQFKYIELKINEWSNYKSVNLTRAKKKTLAIMFFVKNKYTLSEISLVIAKNYNLEIRSETYSRYSVTLESRLENFLAYVNKEQATLKLKLLQEEKIIEEFTKEINNIFFLDFINSENLYYEKYKKIKQIKEELFKKIKRDFVKAWLNQNIDKIIKISDEQAEAIGCINHNIQLIARAGSGKTSTIVNRALFLQKHCGIAPHEMLLLAFNRKAAEEIKTRLAEKLGDNLPHVMTFHALAYALVHPEEDLLIDQSDGSQMKSRALQSIIDDHLRDAYFSDKIRLLMLDRFRGNAEEIEEYRKSPEEIIEDRRSMFANSDILTKGLDGNNYKSFGEKAIANFLFEHDISYKYERNYKWNGVNYRPDFTIFKSAKTGIIIEYFGLGGDPKYDEMSEEKRVFWKNNPSWSFLELFPEDLKADVFVEKIKQKLEELNIPYRKLSNEEIWERIKNRAIDDFTKAMVQFIQRCRKLSLTVEQLQQKNDEYHANFVARYDVFKEKIDPKFNQEQKGIDVVKRFHDLGKIFYSAYLDRLCETGEEDFDGLMQRSANLVKNGQTIFRRKAGVGNIEDLKYIFIDEYQDFSELFYNLIDAIRQQNSNALFFCVGDDWQAINGFAGSDLRFFMNFSNYFPGAQKLYLSTNYRSFRSIVDVSNSLMIGLGKPGIAYKSETGNVKYIDLDSLDLNKWEKELHSGDLITPAILRIVHHKLKNDQKVVLLSRKSYIHWYTNRNGELDDFIKYIYGYFRLSDNRRHDLTISTAHKYKGLEKAVVIVMDAVERCYPLIHPDWIFMKIFGDTRKKIIEDERRLFYVALSRAVDELLIVTDTKNDKLSPFIKDLVPIPIIDWTKYPYVPPAMTSGQFLIEISNQETMANSGTYEIKDLLKSEQYEWNSCKRTWSKIIKSDELDLYQPFKNSCWASDANDIEITVSDPYSDKPIAIFHINEGNFVRINFEQRIAAINKELQKLKWSEDQGREYLQEHYQKRSRHQLSDQQLDEFLDYLKNL